MEVFCTKIPPSKNNFRARVPQEDGSSHAHVARAGFVGPNMVKSAGDLEEGRKPEPVIWDEPRLGSAGDLEAGMSNILPEEKDGSFSSSASPDLARAMQLEGSEGRATSNRHSSWGRRSGNWEISQDVMALTAGIGESNRTVNSSTQGVISENH